MQKKKKMKTNEMLSTYTMNCRLKKSVKKERYKINDLVRKQERKSKANYSRD